MDPIGERIETALEADRQYRTPTTAQEVLNAYAAKHGGALSGSHRATVMLVLQTHRGGYGRKVRLPSA